jgi:hypothetical protein
VFGFEDHPDVVSIHNTFQLLRNTLHIWHISRTRDFCPATLGINDRVNETLEIAVELEITSQDADFSNQIMLFLAYNGSSAVTTLD